MQKIFSDYLEIIKKINITKFIIILISALIFLMLLAAIVIKRFSYSLIENNLSNYIGLKIELVKPKTYIDSHFSIVSKADYVNFYDKNTNKKYVSIVNPALNIKPISLLFKKINIKNLAADNIQIHASCDKEGKIDIFNSINIDNLKKIDIYKYNLSRLFVDINNIDIFLNDEHISKTNTVVNLKNNTINFSKRKKLLKIYQSGTIKTTIENNTHTSDILVDVLTKYPIVNTKDSNDKFDIKITDFNLKNLNGLFKMYISKDINYVSGNAQFSVTPNFESKNQKLSLIINKPVLYLNNNKVISPYDKINFDTDFLINKDNIIFENAKLISNKLNVQFSGKVEKLFSKNFDLKLKTKIADTQLNNFVYFIPDNLIFYRPKGIPVLKSSNFFATLDGDINIALSPVDVTGNLKLSDVYIPNYKNPIRNNDVNIIFMKDKMRVYTRVYTPQNEYVNIDGISNLDNSISGQYAIKSTNNIDLAFAKAYLVPIQQIIGFNIGPVPIMDLSGSGNIDIKTKGSIFDAQVFGTFNAVNATAKIDGLDAKITNGTCRLIFDNRTLIFKEVKGNIDKALFSLSGSGNTKGDVVLDASIKNARTSQILDIFNNSEITSKYKFLTKNIAATSGLADVNINLSGRIKDYETKEFLNDLLIKGKLKLINNKVILTNKLSLKNINGILDFGDSQNADFAFNLSNSKINLKLNSSTPIDKIVSKNELDAKIHLFSPEIKSQDIFDLIFNSNLKLINKNEFSKIADSLIFSAKVDVKSAFDISLDNFEIKNLKNDGYISGINKNGNTVNFNSGLIKFTNNKLMFDNLELGAFDGKIKFNGFIANYLAKHPQNNFFISFKNINLDKLNGIVKNLKLKDAVLNNGLITAKNNEIKLESFNMSYQTVPVFLSASLKNPYGKKSLNAHFSTILTEQSTDNTINAFLTAPIKIKNEIPIKGVFSGQSDDYSLDFTVKIPKESDISFNGSNIGDTNSERELSGRLDVDNNIVNIKNLRLIKYIKNQNKKTNAITYLKAEGRILQQNSALNFNNFKISTNNPTNVRLLNTIFKKSLLKKGNFECAVLLNGNVNLPKATGRLVLNDIDIPLYDTVINNIKLNFADKIIDGQVLAKNKQSDLKIDFKAENKLTLPLVVEKISIDSNKLNINEILQNAQTDTIMSDILPKQETLKTQDVIIKNGDIDVKEISYNKVIAQNLKSTFTYDNNMFVIKSAALDIADGDVELNGKYNTKNTHLNLKANMQNCDSNVLASQFLNLQNQIFGKIDGTASLDAKIENTPDNLKDLKSSVDFSIENGKMPKLGSLEYLLRAGNLVKNGILGLSLNNLIQVLTPYKTGEFEKISGNIKIQDAKIENLEIYSKGKNLSLFLEGKYNILDNYANIQIYGKLSQSISNALGKVGNASLRQIFDAISDIAEIKNEKRKADEQNFSKIPPIENENQSPRLFKVKVLGDINKDNYIKSFNWE